MARFPVVDSNGRLKAKHLPSYLDQEQLNATYAAKGEGGSGTGGVNFTPDPNDSDYVVVSGGSAALDPGDNDYALLG